MEDMERLQEHGLNTLNGTYPPWFHRAVGAVTTVPLFKTSQQQNTALRPLGLASSMVRVLERIQSRQNRPALQAYLEPQQQAMSMAGAHRLVHMVRMYMEMNPTHVCVKLDVTNAYPTMSRAAVLEVLESEPELRHMSWSFVTSMAAPTGL